MDIEMNICQFCRQKKQVQRLYLYPSNYIKPDIKKEALKLYNEGDYFTFIYYCNDCGKPYSKN